MMIVVASHNYRVEPGVHQSVLLYECHAVPISPCYCNSVKNNTVVPTAVYCSIHESTANNIGRAGNGGGMVGGWGNLSW